MKITVARTDRRRVAPLLVLAAVAFAASRWAGLHAEARPAARPAPSVASGWRTDPAWHGGKAEWALYDAVRPIYGVPRRYEATLFTNTQHMDPETTTKAADPRAPGSVAVFKHNLSEMIPTENYTYRFLTTCFVRSSDVEPVKIVMSSQEDCGSTYKQFVVDDALVRADAFCYFPDAGARSVEYRPTRDLPVRFHDALSLTLRDYPFDDPARPILRMRLVPDQTDTHETAQRGEEASVSYAGRETLEVPYGVLDTHHLRVDHALDGGTTTTDYWFAADPALRHVMVKYDGPYGVRYELKQLAWWAYWDRGQPRP